MFIHFQTCVDDTTRSEEEKNENIERIFPAKTKLSCWPAAGEKNNDLLKSLKLKEEDKVAKWENKDFFSLFLCSMLMLSDAQNGLNQPSRVLTGLNQPTKSPNG